MAAPIASGVDDAVKAIGITFTDRGQTAGVTSYSDTGMTAVVNSVAYAYNGFGLMATQTQTHAGTGAQTVTYTYTLPGSGDVLRLFSTQYPSGRKIALAYNDSAGIDDKMNRVWKIVDATGTEVELAAFDWLGAGTSVKVTMQEPGLALTAIKLDPADPSGDAGDQYIGRDRFGRLEDVEAPDENFDERYNRNTLYQITGMTRGKLNQNRTAIGAIPDWREGWQLDQMGNWLQYNTAVDGAGTLTQPRSFNVGNEILFIGGTNTVTAYDPNGNMTVMPKVGDWNNSTPLVAQQLKWDAWNRLVQITEGAVHIGTYAFDGLARRIRKITGAAADVVRDFDYNGSQLIEEWAGGASAADKEYVWGADGALLLRDTFTGSHTFSARHYAIHDGQSITAIYGISDSQWKVVNRLAYRAYGLPEMLTRNFVPTTDTGWEWRWNGWYWDAESGLYPVTQLPLAGGNQVGLYASGGVVYSAGLGRIIAGRVILGINLVIAAAVDSKEPTLDFEGLPINPNLPSGDPCRNPCKKGALPKEQQRASGGVVCCGGKKYSCSWAGSIEGKDNRLAVKIFNMCAVAHEKQHEEEVEDCDPNIKGAYRPVFKRGIPQRTSELETKHAKEEAACLRAEMDKQCTGKNSPAERDCVKKVSARANFLDKWDGKTIGK